MDLASEHERYLCEHIFHRPTIIYNYPKGIKAFYMRATRSDESFDETVTGERATVEAFDLLMPGLGELIGGSTREESFVRLLSRIEEEGLNPKDYTAYLDLRRYGSLPHGGFGLGFERFVSWVSGVGHLREVTPYIRAYGCPL